MASTEYIQGLELTIEHLLNDGAIWIESVPMVEIFRGNGIWKGMVQVFSPINHSKAKRAYVWFHREGQDDSDKRFVSIPEFPGVPQRQIAVQVAIVAEVKGKARK